MSDINIFKVLDFMRDNAPAYAKAKAERIFIEEIKKSKKSFLMKKAESEGYTTAAAQEREAYAHEDYIQLIEGLRAAVEIEETLRWQLVAAETKCEVWRSIQASNRAMDRAAS